MVGIFIQILGIAVGTWPFVYLWQFMLMYHFHPAFEMISLSGYASDLIAQNVNAQAYLDMIKTLLLQYGDIQQLGWVQDGAPAHRAVLLERG